MIGHFNKGECEMRHFKKFFFKYCVILVYLIIPISVLGTGFIDDRGVVGSSYIIQYQGEYALLSRDGGIAKKVSNHTKITEPGTYYLNTWDQKGSQKMTCFTVIDSKSSLSTNKYSISSQESLEEIFKHILNNYKQNVIIQLDTLLTIDEANQLFAATLENVITKYPLLNYDSYVIKAPPSKRVSTFSLTLKYPPKTQRYEVRAVDLIHEIIEKNMSPQLKDYEKEWLLYDSLVKHTTYSNQIVDGVAPSMTHTVQGTMVDQVGVCDGYAKTLMYMLNAVGIPTQLVVGTAVGSSGEVQPHAWNMVKIQEQYYHIDATWGDQDTQSIGTFYDYFNETDDYMARTHVWDRRNYPTAKSTNYTLVNIPIELEGVYRASTPNEWKNTLKRLSHNQIQEATLILSGTQLLAKGDIKLLDELVQTLHASIQYNILDKYGVKVMIYSVIN